MEMERVSKWVCIILVSMMAFLEIQATGSDDVPVPDITLVQSAVSSGAVCLDGSPPAYQFDKGRGKGVKNWLVHLEGGQWCESREKCARRANTNMGSSHLMQKLGFTGIMSNNRTTNSNFFNWNRVLVRYCDGSCFTGDVKNVVEVSYPMPSKLHLRGARVFDAVMDHLLAKGMAKASNVLLSGCSAGGLATILHCDKFRALFPPTTRVKCLSDGGYFLHAKDAAGGYRFAKVFRRLADLHESAKNLPVSCTSKMKRPGLCFFPQYVVPQIRTPVFILNSAYDTFQISNILASGQVGQNGSWVKCQFDIGCTAQQIKSLMDFRKKFVRTVLNKLDNLWTRGAFINTCHTHCQSLFQPKWSGYPDSKLHKKAIGNAVGDWFYERKRVQLVDKRHGFPHWCAPYDPSEPNPNNNYTWGS